MRNRHFEERAVGLQIAKAIETGEGLVEGVTFAIPIQLTAREVQTICGPTASQSERERRCREWVTNFLSPAMAPRFREMSEVLDLMSKGQPHV